MEEIQIWFRTTIHVEKIDYTNLRHDIVLNRCRMPSPKLTEAAQYPEMQENRDEFLKPAKRE